MFSRRRVLAMTGVAAAAIAMPAIVRAAPIQIILSHATAESHPGHIGAMAFKEAAEKLLPGQVEVQVFGNRQLGDDKQNVESALAGTVQMAGVSTVLVPLVTGRPGMDALQLPFLIRDYDHFGQLAKSPEMQAILDDLEEAGLVGLGVADIGQRNFLTTKKPVTSLPDFQGVKTRIVPVPLHQKIWETVGAAPVGLPYGEVYGALETGVLDGVEINVSSIVGENLWEVGKHFTLTGHYPWPFVIIANKAWFDGLPKEVQDGLREAGRQMIDKTLAYAKEQDLSAREDLKAKGVEIHELQDLEEMKTRVKPIIDEWSAKSPLIKNFVDAAQKS
jgi:tripartite ATP-independent transporter DctP family solute receptor